MELVKLTTCWNAIEAELIKGKLESEGIPCIAQGAGMSRVEIGCGGMGNTAFSIQILVHEHDYQRAQAILELDVDQHGQETEL